ELIAREMAAQGWEVTASVGAATFLRPPADVDVMIHRADALMYAVKRRGKNRFEHEEIADARGSAPASAGHERMPSGRRGRAWAGGGTTGGEQPPTVRDLAGGGVGLPAPSLFPPQALVMIEPPPGEPGKALLARVVRCAPAEGGWMHGCVLY